MRSLRSLCLCMTVMCAARFTLGQTGLPEPSTQTATLKVQFAHPEGSALTADLYLPKGEGPFPGVIFIHGGGWSSGDRSQLRLQAAYLAEHGFVGMAIDYRLAPAHPFPAALEDSESAVLWLRTHAAEYHVDPKRIGVVGSSAGGHLAAMLGTESSAHQQSGTSVQAVVVLNGIFDLARLPDAKMVQDLLGKPCTDVPDRCSNASPIEHVHVEEPPFLVMHGDADAIAPYSQATDFVDALRSKGNHPDFYTAPGGPHTFWAKSTWAQTSLDRIAAFLMRELAPQPPNEKDVR